MFPSFFSEKSPTRKVLQQLNTLNLVYLTYHFYNDPNSALSENGFSFFMSLVNVCALRDDSSSWSLIASHFVSAGNLGAIYANVMSGASHYPIPVNGFQAMLNVSNILLGAAMHAHTEDEHQHSFIDNDAVYHRKLDTYSESNSRNCSMTAIQD